MNEEQKRSREVLDDFLECDEGLSGWEIGFIDDMNEKRNLMWSQGQIDKLDQIYERAC